MVRTSVVRRLRTRLLAVVAALTMLTAVIIAVGPAEATHSGTDRVSFYLTVLHNNDGESQLVDLGGDLEDFGGAARFKTVVDDSKRSALRGPWDQLRDPEKRPRTIRELIALIRKLLTRRGVIMVSSGDNFLAGPEFNAGVQNGIPFYDTIALDLIGYDALAIGNHDFDFGPDILADFIDGYRKTKPPYVSSNLDFTNEPRLQAFVDSGRIAASIVVRERGQRIGIIGATTPNIDFISSPRNTIINDDVAGAVQAEVDKLERMGVNKIVLISHLQDINGDIELASMLHGVDIMVAGGGGELLANDDDLLVPNGTEIFGPYPILATDKDGTPVPVVTTEGSYSYLGNLIVGFDRWGNVIEIDGDSGPIRIAGGDNPDAVKPNAKVQRLAIDPVVEALANLDQNVIGTSEDDLDGTRASVRSVETNEGDLIADALLWQSRQVAADFGLPNPDVALQNGGGIRNDSVIPAGDITELDTFDMVPFPNFVSVVPDIPRSQFKEILENAVSRTQPGDTPGGSGRFAQVAGFSYVYSTTGTAQVLNEDGTVAVEGTRVREVVLDDGTVIVTGGNVLAGDDITVATINFLANGGDEYPYRGAPFTKVGATYQQALFNYIVDGLGGTITATDYPAGGVGRIATGEGNVNLQMLAINDFHGNIATSSGSFGGTGRADFLAANIAAAEAAADNSIFVSAGDLIGASPLISALFHDEPTIEAMNLMGLNINGVGNHEFDEGPAELLRMANGGSHPVDGDLDGDPFAGADFEFLSANVVVDATGDTLFAPYTVRTFGGVDVAFIGMTLEGTPTIVTPSGVAGLTFNDEADTVNALIPEIQALGIESIVVLLHEGGSSNGGQNDCGTELTGPVAEIVPLFDDAVDVVITGHTNDEFICEIDGIWVTMADNRGRLFTDIDVVLDVGTGDMTVVAINNVANLQAGVTPDPAVTALIDKYDVLSAPLANSVIGTTTTDITRTNNGAGESALGDIIADAQLEATESAGTGAAVVAFMNPGGIRNDITFVSAGPELDGEFTFGEAFGVQPFGNSLVTMTLTGAQIDMLLEQQWDGQVNPRILQVSDGFTYTWDFAMPDGSKVDASTIAIGGVTIVPGDDYRVTVNSFLADGGDNFAVLVDGTDRLGGEVDLDALVTYFGLHSPVAPGPQDRITRLN